MADAGKAEDERDPHAEHLRFFFEKEARSLCSSLKKRTKKLSFLSAILVRPRLTMPIRASDYGA
jgi:hypothetical protein